MRNAERYPFVPSDAALGEASSIPAPYMAAPIVEKTDYHCPQRR
jgi:hypothetical protein